MQTFVPYSHPKSTAAVLDLSRLGKQIIEARQIGRAITDPSYGWQYHPAVEMWRGYLKGLMVYTAYMHREWYTRRGKTHLAWQNMKSDHLDIILVRDDVEQWKSHMPGWVFDSRVIRSHQSNLLRKDPKWYSPYFSHVPDNIPYFWPTKQ